MPDCDCDVLIVGAGPAGLAAAIAVKREGLSYLVLDKGGLTVALALSAAGAAWVTTREPVGTLRYAVGALGYKLNQILIFGRSIGTTVAVHISQNVDIAGLILITPLTSAKAHAKARGLGFLSFLAGKAFDNLSKIQNIRCPLLVVHGTKDEILPFSMGREIVDRANAEKSFVIIEGAGHNNLSQVDPEKYWGSIASFIRKTGHLKIEGD